MGHKDKGHAGLEPHFLEEQPLPAKERERERELVMGKMQISSNKSVHSSVTVSPHTQTMKHIPDIMKGLLLLPGHFQGLPQIISFPGPKC